MISRKLICALAVGAALAAPAHAELLHCQVTIDGVGTNPSGLVMIDTPIGTLYMCSLSGTYVGISPETCKGHLSMFMTARARGTVMDFLFDFGSAAAPTCSYGVVGNWAIPSPYPYYWRFK